MPHKYTASDQVRFLGEWFDTWSDYQKDDFLKVLDDALTPSSHVNGIINEVSDIKLSVRRPSLFDCQVKLFKEWFHAFTPDEQSAFLNHLKENDSEFYAKLNKTEEVKSEEIPETTNPKTNGVSSVNKEECTSPESSSSSPMSSISQPQSAPDSGLEENTAEVEVSGAADSAPVATVIPQVPSNSIPEDVKAEEKGQQSEEEEPQREESQL